MGILNIGISGLNAAQAGLATTSHNISNVNTPGYSRQEAVQSTNTPQFTGSGFIGQGTNISTVKRAYSDFLVAQTREAQSQSGQMDSLSSQLQNIDNILADPQVGLSPALDSFFSAVNTVASNPSDTASRQNLISGGQILTTRFRDISGQLDGLRDQANSIISQSVASINSDATQVAALNDRIATALGTSGNPPNDLLDQRDALLRDMAGKTRISVVQLADGTSNVFMGNGQALVLGSQSNPLTAQADPADPSNLAVGMTIGGKFQAFGTAALSGGTLGGTLAFRQALDGAENGLGRIAATLSASFNAQHDVGQDLNGNMGTDFFAAGVPKALANANNTGNAVLGAAVSNASALTTSDYKLAYDGANYTLTRLSDNSQQTFSTLPQTVDGVAISLASGAPAAGDTFLIQPTRNGAQSFSALISDPARIAAALPVRAATASANSGTGKLAVNTVTPPAGANLTQPVTITFTSATTFNVSGTGTGNPTGLTFTPGMSISYNGWSATLSGTPAAGDTFGVGSNSGGSGDNGNANALAGLQLGKLLSGGTASLSDAYAQMVNDVGNQTHAAASGAAAQKTVLTNADAAQQSVSGVNLDEEAANLLKYQQAYQAASKVIATANSLFDEILGLMK